MNSSFAALMLMGLAAGVSGGTPCYHNPQIHTPRKCALPGCDKETTTGYCCAEHCREHRRLLRAERRSK